MPSFLAALIGAAVAAPVDPMTHLRRLDQGNMNCFVRIEVPGDPVETQACSFAAIHSYALVPAKGQNRAFEKLLHDLWEPLIYRSTGGDDALAARVIVTSAEADFARSRAAVLTVPALGKARKTQSRAPFAWVSERGERQRLVRRWTVIRDRDCEAYRVRDCHRRLDAGLQNLMDQTAPSGF